jgi:hypothetical protein
LVLLKADINYVTILGQKLWDATYKDAIIFGRVRRKRHSSVYDIAGSLSDTEAESAVRHAEVLIRMIEGLR